MKAQAQVDRRRQAYDDMQTESGKCRKAFRPRRIQAEGFWQAGASKQASKQTLAGGEVGAGRRAQGHEVTGPIMPSFAGRLLRACRILASFIPRQQQPQAGNRKLAKWFRQS